MARTHRFACTTRWTGADRGPILSYDDYSRDHMIEIAGKPALACSADGTFLGDSSRHNPEDLLVAALSACHLLSYLAFCARAGVAVVAYEDAAEGTMTVRDRRMRFTEVVLRPRVA
ncbi:MAG: OsmC family protein, partial [Alphaproteobacteria bacterium]